MKFFTASVALSVYHALYPTPKINRRRNVKNREVPKFCSAEILYIYSIQLWKVESNTCHSVSIQLWKVESNTCHSVSIQLWKVESNTCHRGQHHKLFQQLSNVLTRTCRTKPGASQIGRWVTISPIHPKQADRPQRRF